MRVLWLVSSNNMYEPKGCVQKFAHNGGGWITSAQKLIMCDDNVKLGVLLLMDNQPWKCVQNGVIYYPIKPPRKRRVFDIFKALTNSRNFNYETDDWNYLYGEFKKVLEDFKPDIIHVYGSEKELGLISNVTDIPLVLHIQGFVNPYLIAFLPPGMSWKYFLFNGYNLKTIIKQLLVKANFNKEAFREKVILRSIKYYMGRTAWDERVTKTMNPNAKYFHCDEVLRDVFYKQAPRQLPDKLTIVTTISGPPYKGADLVLKTAKLLKENLIEDFDWYVYGINDCKYMERHCHINHSDVHVKIMGIVSADELKKAELNATLYVHPSYIENSPNSLCEAQMLGLACIATNVGGTSSLIEDNKTGFLVPSNDPYQLAFLIDMLYKDNELNLSIGKDAQKVALARHNRAKIAQRIVSIYQQILNEQ